MTSRGLAVSIMPLDNRREALVATAVAADRLGYDGFFLPETWALDVTIVLAEAATKTSRIALGSGILSVWGRSAGTLAMAASTLASLSGGRFVLGLGTSTAQLAEGLHDVPFVASTRRLRRVVTQVRALLRGDRIPLEVATSARALKLNVPPAPDVPIYLAALADESIRLAGELADGWVPFLYPVSQLAAGQVLLREGAARAADAGRMPRLCPSIPTVVADDPAKAREGAAWFVAFYLTTMGPLYRRSLVRQGFGKELEAVLAANTPKFTGLVPGDAERLLEELTVHGTPASARARLARWYAAGASLPVLLFRPNLTADEIDFTLEAFRPMLGGAGAARA
jgi:alkanesulfonate monooxygenase SsuD/methylene tetrahydromethanopterin reductase-like flavin-dependent oxidoreductase (luciferase family)